MKIYKTYIYIYILFFVFLYLYIYIYTYIYIYILYFLYIYIYIYIFFCFLYIFVYFYVFLYIFKYFLLSGSLSKASPSFSELQVGGSWIQSHAGGSSMSICLADLAGTNSHGFQCTCEFIWFLT